MLHNKKSFIAMTVNVTAEAEFLDDSDRLMTDRESFFDWITTTLCPGGKERMSRLISVVASGRVDLRPLVTHRFKLDHIEAAYDLFAHQRDGVLKVALTP